MQEAERLHKEQQELAVAEMRIIIENEIKAKYEAARVAELQEAQDLKKVVEEVRILYSSIHDGIIDLLIGK